jgi:predicted ATPase
MFLTIKNTGKLLSAQIEINGITVIAGVNNTGKSTVGKVLFCLFNSFYKIDQQIERERNSRISNIIESQYHEKVNRITRQFDTKEFAEYIVNTKASLEDAGSLVEDLRNFYSQVDKHFEKYLSDDFLSSTSERIMQILSISDDEIFVTVLLRRLQAEFNMQINNIYHSDICSEIKLRVKDMEVKVSILEDSYIDIDNSFSLNTEVIYMDDPLALDDSRFPVFRNENHREHLKTKLFTNNKSSPVKDVIDEIITTKKLDMMFAKLNSVCKGELIKNSKSPRFAVSYREKESETALDIKNVSTGLKTFVILKTLLLNGSLEENGIIILDEPEIHLHPEWQLVFAELIVLLQKEFNMHILINTHSPYFLDAIDVYSHKYEISGRCKYYLAEDENGIASIVDVSDNIEKIYEKLAEPLQKLENERYQND